METRLTEETQPPAEERVTVGDSGSPQSNQVISRRTRGRTSEVMPTLCCYLMLCLCTFKADLLKEKTCFCRHPFQIEAFRNRRLHITENISNPNPF